MWVFWTSLMLAFILWLIIFELTDRNYDSRYLRSNLGERRLSGIEKWCYSRRKFVGAFNLSIMLTVDTTLEEEKLRRSLDKMQKKYAILQSTVVEGPFSIMGTRTPCFKVLDDPPKIPMEVTYLEEGNDSEDSADESTCHIYDIDHSRAYHIQLMEQEINTPVPEPLLARARVVYRKNARKMEVIFTMDHCATDGFGCGSFVKEWIFAAMGVKPAKLTLEQFGYPKGETDEPQDDSTKFVKISPSADTFFPRIPRTAINVWCSLWFLSFLRFLCIPWRSLPAVRRPSDPVVETEGSSLIYDTLLVENHLDVERTRLLIEKCHLENCTVGTALHTALSAAVAEVVTNDGHKNFLMRDYLYAATNIDLRRLAPRALPNYRDVEGLMTGYYGGFTFLTCNTVEFYYRVVEDPVRLWEIAAKQKSSCQGLFKRGCHMFISQVIGLDTVQKIMNFKNRNYLEHDGKMEAPMSFVLSNMGNLGGMSIDSFNVNKPTLFSPDELALFPRLSSVHAAVTANSADPQPIVGSFTFDGKLKLFALFSAASYTREKAQSFLDRAMDILTQSVQAK